MAHLIGIRQLPIWKTLVLLAVIMCANSAYGQSATPNVPPCEDVADQRIWCGLDRPEDITLLPGTRWLVVTDQASAVPLQLLSAQNPQTRLSAHVDMASPPIVGRYACPLKPRMSRIRGHSARKIGNIFELVVIAEQRLEVFAISLNHSPPQFKWVGCIEVPDGLLLNDLTFGADGSLLATHMFDRPPTSSAALDLRNRFLRQDNTGYVVSWSASGGWRKIDETDLSFSNGIAVSADTKTLAVAGTYSQAVLLKGLETGAVSKEYLGFQPDNVTPLPTGGFLITGHTGMPVTGIDPCRPVTAHPCGFAFTVAEISPKAAKSILFSHDGKRLPGASAAVLLDDHSLLLGSAFSDGLRLVDLSKYGRGSSSRYP